MEQKYIKDNDGNIVLPITSVTAVRDNEGQTLAAKIEELELKSDGNNNLIKTEESRAKDAESSLHNSVVSTNNALNTERSERTAAEAQLRAELNAKQYEAEAIELDAVPTKDSTKMVNSGAVYTALQDMVYDVSVKHPASGVDSGNTYTLSGALAVIPSADRKPGMSIKFIDSEKNEYVQYRLMSDSWSINTDDWAISDEGIYVKNPEFVRVYTDSENRILWAIKTDGSIYYGAGCPQQVIDYINEKISELFLDEYEDIVSFLSDYLGSDTTLKIMIGEINDHIATKVDKVEGKSLIDAEYSDGVSQIENTEFAEAHTDADNKILYGVKHDGDFYFGAGVPSQIQKELDNKVDKIEGKSLINSEYASAKSTVNNLEFLEVTLDTQDKVLEGIQTDGTKVIGADIEVGGNTTIGGNINVGGDMEISGVLHKTAENLEWVYVIADKNGKIIGGIDTQSFAHFNFNEIPPIVKKEIKAHLLNFKNVPRISWIDDDMNLSDQAHIDCFTKLRTWANQNGIRPDIALIPSYTFTDETETDLATVTFNNERLNIVKELEKEGFHFLMHPVHKGMYNNSWNHYISDAYANKNIAMCIRAFKEACIEGYNVLVYPGSSAAIAHNVALAKACCDYAITPWNTSSTSYGVNIAVDHNRYELARYGIERALENKTVAEIKTDIDEAIANNAWIIFCSHCWDYSGNIDDPVTERGCTFANLFEIISYANSKVPIMPTQQVWNERKIMWEYYENN